jgi:hypothetical protein
MKQLLVLLLLLPATLLAQHKNLVLEGSVADSTGAGLPSASVVLLQQRDSVLLTFGVTNDKGQFAIRRVPPGNYLLQINYLGYEPYSQPLALGPEQATVALGAIALKPRNTLLGAVDISAQQAPLSLRKDTIVYNAAAFQTQPGAVVEDLLRKLPGVEVQPDGTIKAMGETVQNVLVEGKEFFGQDPKIATKNLPADAVDKVQLFDRKSEMAEFTGIEDGQDAKTINLQLKEDRKHGYFGNFSAAGGSQSRFEGKFNLNRFGGGTQLSFLGAGNNTNQQSFSFEDYLNLMGGLSNFMSGGGGGGRVRIELNPEDAGMPFLGNANQGFNTTWSGGANFNRDFSPKTELSANYFYSRIRSDLDRSATRQNLLETGGFDSEEQETRRNGNSNHRLNLTLQHRPDSAQQLRFRARLSANDAVFRSMGLTQSFEPGGGPALNSGLRDYDAEGRTLRGEASLLYRRRMGRKGRALMAELSYRDADDARDATLDAENRLLGQSTRVRQRQDYRDEAANLAATLSYTEPLGKKQYLEWQIARQQYRNQTRKDFFDRVESPTPAEVFNPLLSNDFRRGYRYDRTTMRYLLNRKKYNLTLGSALQHSVLDGATQGLEPTLRRDFTRLLPSAFFNYEPGIGRNFSVDYSTEFREPSLEQLQPVVDNSDPLNTYVGNPDLRPEYAHNLELSLMRFDQFTMTSFFASLRGTYTHNRITNAASIDSLLRRNTQPVNVPDETALNAYLSFGRPLRWLKSTLNISLSSDWNRGILFVNAQRNNTDRWQNTVSISVDNRKKDKFDLSIGTQMAWNSTRYAQNPALNQGFLNQRHHADLTFFPTKKWAIGTGMDYGIYSAESFGGRREVPLWRASLTRYLLKNNRGQLRLAVFDLLNRNVGIQRSSSFNFLQEERVRTLSRYATLSFAYALSGFGAAAGSGLEMRVIRRD